MDDPESSNKQSPSNNAIDFSSIFQNVYNRKQFIDSLIRPVLGVPDDSGYPDGRDYLNNWPELKQTADKAGITQCKTLGKLAFNKELLHIIEIALADDGKIETNRIDIHGFVRELSKYIRSEEIHSSGILIVLYYESNNDAEMSKYEWLISLYTYTKCTRHFSNDKRFTYRFGPNLGCRTANCSFIKLYNNKNLLSLKALEEEFSVEAMTREFYKGRGGLPIGDKADNTTPEQWIDIFHNNSHKFGYYQWYQLFQSYIILHCDDRKCFGNDFSLAGKTPDKIESTKKAIRDYVKKLFGRIVFLFFLQKKGWLGCKSLPGSHETDWNSGNRNFMQLLIDTYYQNPEKYNYTKGSKEYIGFLDAVLEPFFFECLNKNRKDDIFSPQDNIIFNTDFKDLRFPYLSGGLFQPDDKKLPISRFPNDYFKRLFDFFNEYNFTIDENSSDDIEIAVDPEMLGKIFEGLLEDNKDKGAYYTPKEIVRYMCCESLIAYLSTDDAEHEPELRNFVYNHILPPDSTIQQRQRLLLKLKNIKICDPAIGSGAFPMGLLQELLQCRRALGDDSSDYELKKHIIQNNIYGVDIDPGAVDIARLRFWLSLIVDADTPEPLPNLNYNIMQGNALLEWYQGHDLSRISNDIYSNETCTEKKTRKNKKELGQLSIEKIYEHIQQLLKERANLDLKGIDPSSNNQFFLWHTWFKDVFDKGGFDIVIGNPPYIDSEKMSATDPITRSICSKLYEAAKGNWDIYIAFFNLGYNLLSDKSILAFITPNKWLSIPYGQALRNLYGKDIFKITDYSEVEVFEAGVNPIVTFMRKGLNSNTIDCTKYKSDYSIDFNFHNLNKSIAIHSDNYSLLFSKRIEILNVLTNNKTISDYYTVVSAGATNDAYKFAKLTFDSINDEANVFKVITTGAIRKFRNLWGIKRQRIDKEYYFYPCISRDDLMHMHQMRFSLAKSPKILVSGRRYLDAFADFKGEYAPYQSVPLILQKKLSLKALLPILNSSVAFFFMYESFSGLALDGGITFTWENLSYIPFPELSDSDINRLESYADELIQLGDKFNKDDLKDLDTYVCSLYFRNIPDKTDYYTNIIVSFGQQKMRKRV